jgi:hypothetical protein
LLGHYRNLLRHGATFMHARQAFGYVTRGVA